MYNNSNTPFNNNNFPTPRYPNVGYRTTRQSPQKYYYNPKEGGFVPKYESTTYFHNSSLRYENHLDDYSGAEKRNTYTYYYGEGEDHEEFDQQQKVYSDFENNVDDIYDLSRNAENIYSNTSKYVNYIYVEEDDKIVFNIISNLLSNESEINGHLAYLVRECNFNNCKKLQLNFMDYAHQIELDEEYSAFKFTRRFGRNQHQNPRLIYTPDKLISYFKKHKLIELNVYINSKVIEACWCLEHVFFQKTNNNSSANTHGLITKLEITFSKLLLEGEMQQLSTLINGINSSKGVKTKLVLNFKNFKPKIFKSFYETLRNIDCISSGNGRIESIELAILNSSLDYCINDFVLLFKDISIKEFILKCNVSSQWITLREDWYSFKIFPCDIVFGEAADPNLYGMILSKNGSTRRSAT